MSIWFAHRWTWEVVRGGTFRRIGISEITEDLMAVLMLVIKVMGDKVVDVSSRGLAGSPGRLQLQRRVWIRAAITPGLLVEMETVPSVNLSKGCDWSLSEEQICAESFRLWQKNWWKSDLGGLVGANNPRRNYICKYVSTFKLIVKALTLLNGLQIQAEIKITCRITGWYFAPSSCWQTTFGEVLKPMQIRAVEPRECQLFRVTCCLSDKVHTIRQRKLTLPRLQCTLTCLRTPAYTHTVCIHADSLSYVQLYSPSLSPGLVYTAHFSIHRCLLLPVPDLFKKKKKNLFHHQENFSLN